MRYSFDFSLHLPKEKQDRRNKITFNSKFKKDAKKNCELLPGFASGRQACVVK